MVKRGMISGKVPAALHAVSNGVIATLWYHQVSTYRHLNAEQELRPGHYIVIPSSSCDTCHKPVYYEMSKAAYQDIQYLQ